MVRDMGKEYMKKREEGGRGGVEGSRIFKFNL